MSLSVALTSRGLLELGIDEHREVVSVKKRRLHDQAKLAVYRLGVLAVNTTTSQVEIEEYGSIDLR